MLTRFQCGVCDSICSKFERVLPLPSSCWSELADSWFCHQSESGAGDLHSGSLSPRPGLLRELWETCYTFTLRWNTVSCNLTRSFSFAVSYYPISTLNVIPCDAKSFVVRIFDLYSNGYRLDVIGLFLCAISLHLASHCTHHSVLTGQPPFD